jgi:hypothetical protein
MCLEINHKTAVRIRRRFAASKKPYILGYKIITVDNHSHMFDHNWNTNGVHKSTRHHARVYCYEYKHGSIYYSYKHGVVYKGFHVFLNKSSAQKEVLCHLSTPMKVIQVRCRPEHFVAAGKAYGHVDAAVFTKVEYWGFKANG